MSKVWCKNEIMSFGTLS